jgi:Zn-finger nucleic acid-binding protein
MNCPACGGTLTPVDVSGLTIDVCQGGCAGMWFDQSELHALDEPADKAGEILVKLAGQPVVTVDLAQRRRCPKCPNSVLMRHFYSAKRAVTVDECPTCAGTWLDGGELEQIRREYDSGGARRQAAHACLEEILASDRMAQTRAELREQLPSDTFRSRIVSSLLVVFYVVGAFKLNGGALALRMFYQSVVPWACVCFPEAFSGAISPLLGTTRRSPRLFVWFFGWLVLLLPIIQIAIVWAETSGPLG